MLPTPLCTAKILIKTCTTRNMLNRTCSGTCVCIGTLHRKIFKGKLSTEGTGPSRYPSASAKLCQQCYQPSGKHAQPGCLSVAPSSTFADGQII